MAANGTVDILQVITSDERRGGGQFAVDLAAELVSLGRSVETVALVASGADEPLKVDSLGIEALGRAELRALRDRMRPAAVAVAHGSKSLPACFFAGLGIGTPFVYRNIGDPYFWGNTRLRRLRSRALLSRAAAVVALTDETAAGMTELYGVKPARTTTISMGAPADRFRPLGADGRATLRSELELRAERPVALFLGALSTEKNVDLAIASASAADLDLVVVGDGPERARLEALDGPRVRFVGAVSRPERYLQAVDVLVLTSDTEGLPGVLIEAGLCGLPAVTTDVGFVRSIVRHAETGFVVESGSAGEIAVALRAAVADRDELGAAARAWCVERFAMDAVGERWNDVLTPFIEARHRTTVTV